MTVYQVGETFRSSKTKRVAVFECGCGIRFAGRVDVRPVSCGCKKKQNQSEAAKRRPASRTTHGKFGTKAYRVWDSMIQRCCNKRNSAYPDYGGRGITVCNQWRNSFELFYADMGDPPYGMTIDRKDNEAGYSKDNCRWATAKTQSRNRRSTILITISDVTLCVSDWAKHPKALPRHAISRRFKSGMSPQDSVFGESK